MNILILNELRLNRNIMKLIKMSKEHNKITKTKIKNLFLQN